MTHGGVPAEATEPAGAAAVVDAGGAKPAPAPTDDDVQKVRAWTGLLVVAVGDVAIVVAAIVGIAHVSGSTSHATSVVAILSSGFTAVGTMTTAYFGIRAASNTAQSSMKREPAGSASR